jgi:hypothetical protein
MDKSKYTGGEIFFAGLLRVIRAVAHVCSDTAQVEQSGGAKDDCNFFIFSLY